VFYFTAGSVIHAVNLHYELLKLLIKLLLFIAGFVIESLNFTLYMHKVSQFFYSFCRFRF